MGQIGIAWRALLAQLISFSLVFFVLWKFAYGPIFKMLQARREKIAESLANAEKIKTDVARTEAERQKILADAGDKANKLIDEARASRRPRPRTGNAKGHRRRGTDRRQGARSRRPGTRADARRIEARSRPAGRQNTTTVTGKILTPEDQKRLAAGNRETIGRVSEFADADDFESIFRSPVEKR